MVKERFCFEDFEQELIKEIMGMREGIQVRTVDVEKNNGLVLRGMNILSADNDSNVVPTIYIDDFYEKCLAGEMTVYRIAKQVLKISEENKPNDSMNLDLVTKFENVKNKLRIKLVNTEKNKEFLKNVPHKEIMDLSAVYQILVADYGNCTGTITIHNHLFDMYGISLDELHETALESMARIEPVTIRPMFDVLREMIGDNVQDEFCAVDSEYDMIIVSNTTNICGASAILHEDTLHRLAEIFKQDYFILPSSIHETIAIKVMEDANVEELKAMVTEINQTQVAPEEVLSDSVYYYSIETGKLTIA